MIMVEEQNTVGAGKLSASMKFVWQFAGSQVSCKDLGKAKDRVTHICYFASCQKVDCASSPEVQNEYEANGRHALYLDVWGA